MANIYLDSLRNIVIIDLNECILKLALMNNLLPSIFYDYFHLLFSFGKVWIKNWKSFILRLSWHVAFLPVSGVTILLSLTVFHNIVTEKLPRVSTAMPLLGAGQFSQKLFFSVSQCLCLFVKLFPVFSWQSNSQKTNKLCLIQNSILTEWK